MSDHDPDRKLTEAYQQMMDRARDSMEQLEHRTEKEVLPALQQAVEQAKQRAVELGELSRDEAQQLGRYLKRDLADAGHFLASTGRDLGSWLNFDLTLIENRLRELFEAAVDRSRLELLAYENTSEHGSHYHSGEITGPGTLACSLCGEQVGFTSVSVIPVCPECGSNRFIRVTG